MLPSSVAGFPSSLYNTPPRKKALCDYLTRQFGAVVKASGSDIRHQSGGWGGEKGGDMTVDKPGQHVLERTSVLVHPDGSVEARFTVGLPARGRSVLGDWASTILTRNLPKYCDAGLRYHRQDAAAVQRHIECVEDTAFLRSALSSMGLVAFICNGSILPRKSGASDEPMSVSEAVPFAAPDSLTVQVTLPNRGPVKGLGIRQGITLICGGGFHGKSTLLEALEQGIYDKIPGDGRELIATDPTAVKIRAEDGRRVESVDISPFINNLPLGRPTRCFSTSDASGSTSQATNIQEAVEVGCGIVLIDEDTSATNFMVRDARMRELVAADREPITPFVACVQGLAARGISTVLVVGGTGEYFGVADCVICMHCYQPEDATARAHAIAASYDTISQKSASSRVEPHPTLPARTVVSVHPRPPPKGRGQRDIRVKTRTLHTIQMDSEELDLCAVEQLVEISQTRAVADGLMHMRKKLLGAWKGLLLTEILNKMEEEMDQGGLDAISGGKPGNLARPRRFEIAAALNRLRSAQLKQL